MDESRAGGIEEGVIVGTDLILASARLSPLAIAQARRAGRMEFSAEGDGKVHLEAGGVVIAEGRIVKRGGRSYFKVLRLSAPGNPGLAGR